MSRSPQSFLVGCSVQASEVFQETKPSGRLIGPTRGQDTLLAPVCPAVSRAQLALPLSNALLGSTLSWGRWKDILTHGRFKWHLNEKDMEMICRALLVYCVKHYKGDEKIKSFIWELITPTKDGQAQTLQNHSGARWQCVLPSLFCAGPHRCASGTSFSSQVYFRMPLVGKDAGFCSFPFSFPLIHVTWDVLSVAGPS